MDNTTDAESQMYASPTGTRFSKKVVAAVLAGAAVLLAPVAIHLRQQTALTQGSVVDWIEDQETFGAKMDSCSDATTSCLTSKCCKSAGFQCFKSGAKAQCAQKCPGGSCTVLSPSYTSKPTWANGNSMYCYTVFVQESGPGQSSTKGLELLKYQKANTVGVFACDASSVFSDVAVDIGGASTTAVTPTADWKKYFRKDKPTKFLNTPLFMGAWKQIKAEGAYASFSWTVKADVPTVFLPGLLKDRLAQFPETPTGTYVETCNKVLMGYFGNLEVTSKAGMKRFLEQFESYYNNGGKCWRWDTEACKKQWKYGPWGEDLYMQKCMDDAAVQKKEDYTLTDTGTCPGMRPKADKKNSSYVPSCTDAGAKKFIAIHPMRTLAAWKSCYSAMTS
jgi:hypothetical protein